MRATCAQLKITFDPWQDGAGTAILGKRNDGLYAADAVVVSIPRQVGKTFLVGALVVALCIVEPKLLAVWTAHHGTTAADTFRDLKAIVQQPELAAHVKSVYDSGARLEIVFTNGSRILFGAREHGFGRGFKRVGVLIFDEAQILTSRAADDMVPTTNRHPNPLIVYIGTPPKPSDPSEHFQTLRSEALSGESTDILYLEFSADPDADPEDRQQWAKANPSYPVHTSARAMLRMRKNLGPESFMREALGIWDGSASVGVFAHGSWAKCLTDEPAPAEVACLGIAADPDQTRLVLGAAGFGERPHIGPVLRERFDTGRARFVSEVKRISAERDCPVAIDKRGPASALVGDLEAEGVPLILGGLEDFVQAGADIKAAVETQAVRHRGYPELDAAVDAAGWRKVGERRVLWRRGGQIAELEAVAWALWGATNSADYDVLDSFL